MLLEMEDVPIRNQASELPTQWWMPLEEVIKDLSSRVVMLEKRATSLEFANTTLSRQQEDLQQRLDWYEGHDAHQEDQEAKQDDDHDDKT